MGSGRIHIFFCIGGDIMNDHRKYNYRLDIMLEEWVEGQGCQVLNRQIQVEQKTLSEITTKYNILKNELEKN